MGSHIMFVYGTLKRGFYNHSRHMSPERSVFLGLAKTVDTFPCILNKYTVPFILHAPGQGHHIKGEVWAVDDDTLAVLDELEGVNRGYYTKKVIKVEMGDSDGSTKPLEGVHEATCYFRADTPAELLADPKAFIDDYTLDIHKSYVPPNQRT